MPSGSSVLRKNVSRAVRCVAGGAATAVVLAAGPCHAQQFCESQVLGVLLYDGGSFRKFQEAYGKGEIVEEFGLRLIRYYNSTGNEELTFLLHPGGSIDDVAEVRLKKGRAKGVPLDRRIPGPNFATSRGVVLGMTRASLEAALGQPSAVAAEESRTILRYHCVASVGCGCAVRANMPEYKAFYVFEADSLVHAEFGFPYP
jgi:hypothetical protein